MHDAITLQLLGGLFCIAFLAGFVDAIAGGGGLLTLPALFLAGIPPLQALATNKLQSASGTFTTALLFFRRGLISIRRDLPLFCFAFAGSVAGTLAVQRIDARALSAAVPVVLLCIAVYVLFMPPVTEIARAPRMPLALFRNAVVPAIGWYDGMFGPGTGSFFAVAGVALRGETLVGATATAKFLNFATNSASLLTFLFSGHIIWIIGACMIAGQISGSILATKVMLRIGPRIIRPMIVLVCVGMLTRYASQNWVSPHVWRP